MYNTHTCFHKSGSFPHSCRSQAKTNAQEVLGLALFTHTLAFPATSIKTKHGFFRLPVSLLKQERGKLNAYKQILWSDKRWHLLLTDLLPVKVCECLVIQHELYSSTEELLKGAFITLIFIFNLLDVPLKNGIAMLQKSYWRDLMIKVHGFKMQMQIQQHFIRPGVCVHFTLQTETYWDLQEGRH